MRLPWGTFQSRAAIATLCAAKQVVRTLLARLKEQASAHLDALTLDEPTSSASLCRLPYELVASQ